MSTSSLDIERKQKSKEYLESFADFSQYIASDDALSIYRRFGGLDACNILYLQAESQFLEQKLEKMDKEDINVLANCDASDDSDEKKRIDAAARAWESFVYQAEAGSERQKTRMKLILRIRTVMKDYGLFQCLPLNSILTRGQKRER
jgi:hypothetical protein